MNHPQSSSLHPRRRILMVDDEPSVLEVLDLFLSAEGYEVTSAASGEEALNRLGQCSFDVVLTDRNMPEICGLELAGRIKALNPTLPIILMSGHPVSDVDLHDFVAFLAKPFSRRRLLETLDLAFNQ